MPIQAPQWTDFKLCPICQNEFNSLQRLPVSLGCGHSVCQSCLLRLSRQQCPFDLAGIQTEISKLPVNYALLSLVGGTIPDTFPIDIPEVCQNRRHFDAARRSIEYLAQLLQNCSSTGNGSLGANANGGLTRPMQRKLITLIHCQLAEIEGRCRAVRAARSIGERAVKELILMHQCPQTLSATLWAAVRQRGCQFLGPAMQEAVLQLILLTLEDGVPLSRKVLVLYVVHKLEKQFTQASKTSIGHVVQLLYRASCFKVTKREGDSSLLQLHEKYRTYTALRKEHDAQIVNIAQESGLHISPEQWSALLYGDDEHKSHMQSIIDKLQTPASFGSSIQELIIALQRTNDPHDLQELRAHLELLANVDPDNEAPPPTWQQLEDSLESLRLVMCGLQSFSRDYATRNRGNIEGAQMINTKYRTSMCRDILNRSTCPRGANCNFAHSEEELERYRKRRHVHGSGGRPPLVATASGSSLTAAHSIRTGSSSSPDSIGTSDLEDDGKLIIDVASSNPPVVPTLAVTGISFRPVVTAASNPVTVFHPNQHAPHQMDFLSEGMKAMQLPSSVAPYTGAFQQAPSQPSPLPLSQQSTVRRNMPNAMMKYPANYGYCEVPAPQSPLPIYVTQANQPSYIGSGSAPIYQQQMSHPQMSQQISHQLYQFPTDLHTRYAYHQMYSVPPTFPRYAVARSSEVEEDAVGELSLKIPNGKDDVKDDWKFSTSFSRGESSRDSGRCSSLGYSSDTFSPLSSSSTGSRASPASGPGSCSNVTRPWDSLFSNETNNIWAPPSSKLPNWSAGTASSSSSSRMTMEWETFGPRQSPARKEDSKDTFAGRAIDLLSASASRDDHVADEWKSWPRGERKPLNSRSESLLREFLSTENRPSSYGFGFI